MLYQYLRVFYSNNGALTDYSLQNQDELLTVPLDTDDDEDWVYLGQHYPFNNFFVQMGTVVNAVANSLEIEYWAGPSSEWKSAVDIMDGTKSGTASLAKSGVVQFSPDREFTWNQVGDTSFESTPLGLETLKIYNMYWLRFRCSVTPTANAVAKRIAYAFTRSQQLDNLDVNINQFLTSFAVGKTNWDDEIVTASMQVVQDLKRKGLIISPGQVLIFDDVSFATDIKTLLLIYSNLGPGYAAKVEVKNREYENALSRTRFSFDTDCDGSLDAGELNFSISRLVR